MRKDLNKLMCERERHGSHMHFGQVRHDQTFSDDSADELENVPTRESMKYRYTRSAVGTKNLNENLNPLYGLVRKNVGRPWDKVYGELCKVFNMNSVINKHILQHLFDIVQLHTFEDKGVVYFRRVYLNNNGAVPVKSADGPEYYVHPRTGMLLKNKYRKTYSARQRDRRKEEELEASKNRRVIDATTDIRRKDANSPWVICEIATMPQTEIRTTVPNENGEVRTYTIEAKRRDMWLKADVNFMGTYLDWDTYRPKKVPGYYKRGTYVKSVKAANHKQIKRYTK